MALHDVWVEARFLDAAERTATMRYLMDTQYDDVGENMAAVVTDATAVISALEALTWDQIPTFAIQVEYATASLGANIAANNQVRAFIRALDSADVPVGIEVPAWDDATYDQDSNNLLSPAFNTAAETLVQLLRNPVNGNGFDANAVQWSQSRTRKSGIRLG